MKVFYLNNKVLLYTSSAILLMLMLMAISFSIAGQNAVSAASEPYYNGNTGTNNISLVVNVDWGNEYIPDMLKILDSFDVKATFFLTGRWADENPKLALTIEKQGMKSAIMPIHTARRTK